MRSRSKHRLPRPHVKRSRCISLAEAQALADQLGAAETAYTRTVRALETTASQATADTLTERRDALYRRIQGLAVSLDVAGFDRRGCRKHRPLYRRAVTWLAMRMPGGVA